MAQYFAGSIGSIESALGQDLGPINVFLLPDGETLQEEIVAGGSPPSSGFESGIALLGGERPGIYVDMAAPFYSWRHVAAHEIVHFVVGAIEGDGRAPLWFVEGLADYLAHQVAVEQTGDHERQWARLVRGQGRQGVHLDQWIDFHTIGDYGEWNSERSLDRLKQMYGQSFAALSYVAAAYGEAAFVPLLRAVIEEPDDLNVPFRRILGVSFDEFQAAVREFLLTPTPFGGGDGGRRRLRAGGLRNRRRGPGACRVLGPLPPLPPSVPRSRGERRRDHGVQRRVRRAPARASRPWSPRNG